MDEMNWPNPANLRSVTLDEIVGELGARFDTVVVLASKDGVPVMRVQGDSMAVMGLIHTGMHQQMADAMLDLNRGRNLRREDLEDFS